MANLLSTLTLDLERAVHALADAVMNGALETYFDGHEYPAALEEAADEFSCEVLALPGQVHQLNDLLRLLNNE